MPMPALGWNFLEFPPGSKSRERLASMKPQDTACVCVDSSLLYSKESAAGRSNGEEFSRIKK